ncbi:Protein of unknown function [Gryllus bimaculatus]|nr:Protein of unknown function [Gryllus bimaculatus]
MGRSVARTQTSKRLPAHERCADSGTSALLFGPGTSSGESLEAKAPLEMKQKHSHYDMRADLWVESEAIHKRKENFRKLRNTNYDIVYGQTT